MALISVHLQSFSFTRPLPAFSITCLPTIPISGLQQDAEKHIGQQRHVQLVGYTPSSTTHNAACPLLHTIIEALPCIPEHATINHQQPNINMPLTSSGLKPGHEEGALLTQVTANNFMHFDTLAKFSPANSKKYAATFCIMINEFENRFQDCQNSQQFVYVQLHFQST